MGLSNEPWFVVIAIDVKPFEEYKGNYTSDPYCVWYEAGKFVRWPNSSQLTHWCELPDTKLI